MVTEIIDLAAEMVKNHQIVQIYSISSFLVPKSEPHERYHMGPKNIWTINRISSYDIVKMNRKKAESRVFKRIEGTSFLRKRTKIWNIPRVSRKSFKDTLHQNPSGGKRSFRAKRLCRLVHQMLRNMLNAKFSILSSSDLHITQVNFEINLGKS